VYEPILHGFESSDWVKLRICQNAKISANFNFLKFYTMALASSIKGSEYTSQFVPGGKGN
jgi:hypothetical protein